MIFKWNCWKKTTDLILSEKFLKFEELNCQQRICQHSKLITFWKWSIANVKETSKFCVDFILYEFFS